MYKEYWIRMRRYGNPTWDGLRSEVAELKAERTLSQLWFLELMDVCHQLLRLVHPRLGVLVYPVVRKHALREMGVLYHRR